MRRRLHTRTAVALLALFVLIDPILWSRFGTWYPSGLVPRLIRRVVPALSPPRSSRPPFPASAPSPMGSQFKRPPLPIVVIRKRADGTILAYDPSTTNPPAWTLEDIVPDLPHGQIAPGDLAASEWTAVELSTRLPRGLVAPAFTVSRISRSIQPLVISAAAPVTDAELLALARANADGSGSWFDKVAADGMLRGSRLTDWSINPLALAHDVLWLLALVALIDALAHHRRWLRRPRNPALCTTCGYDRTGLTAAVCPECGAAIA